MNTWPSVWRFVVCLSTVGFIFAGPALPAQKRPATVAELALYNGADRQQILEEGARKEGKLTFYTTHILNKLYVDAFQKKYPFIKVESWRASTNALLPRILEEHKSARHTVDVIEASQLVMLVTQKMGMLQPFYAPNLAFIEEDAITRAPGEGIFRATMRESGIGLACNTKLIAREELPKTYQDLLDPKWRGKGKVAIGFDTSGRSWMEAMLFAHGEEFVRRMANQNFDLHAVTSRGILDMMINGEYRLSPTIYDSHVSASKKKGAPVDWFPLEPVPVTLSQAALYRYTSRPHSALLFLDFEFSKESAEIMKATGYTSNRKDYAGEKSYKKYYGTETAEAEAKMAELFSRLFVKK